MCYGDNIDLQHFKLAIDRKFRERALSAKPRVIDQHINFCSVDLQMLKDASRSTWCGEIGGKNLRLSLVRLPQLICKFLERVALAGEQNESGAIGSKTLCQFTTDA